MRDLLWLLLWCAWVGHDERLVGEDANRRGIWWWRCERCGSERSDDGGA